MGGHFDPAPFHDTDLDYILLFPYSLGDFPVNLPEYEKRYTSDFHKLIVFQCRERRGPGKALLETLHFQQILQ